MKRALPIALATLLFAIALGCAHVAPAPAPSPAPPIAALRSPWDITPVTVTDRPFDCGPPAPLGQDTMMDSLNDPNRHISDAAKDAAYSESTNALKDAAKRVLEAADDFRSTGSRAAASCVLSLLTAAAEDHAMTGDVVNAKAMEYHDLALRAFAVAYLKVHQANVSSPQQDQMVLQWMIALVNQERSYWENSHCGPNGCARVNHKGAETADAAMEIGIAANDRALINYAVNHYRDEVDMIDSQGMLHYDMDHEYALAFNLKSAAALVQIAELAEINGIPLYGYDNGRIHFLVHTVALGLVDPAAFVTATHDTQNIPSSIETWEVSWAAVYDRRFHDSVLAALLEQAGPGGSDMWGGRPWSGQMTPGT